MSRQRNMAQMEKQIKSQKKELNKREISNLCNAEFKTLVTRMLKELSENFNSIKKEHGIHKKQQSERKNKLIKIRKKLQGINSRVDEDENQISNLEYKKAKNTQSEQ